MNSFTQTWASRPESLDDAPQDDPNDPPVELTADECASISGGPEIVNW